MSNSQLQLPKATQKLLKIIKKHEFKISPIAIVDSCSINENWPRLDALRSAGLIAEQQAYNADGSMASGSVLYLTNEGLAYLTDLKQVEKEKKSDRLIGAAISAAVAALISWGPSILKWILQLFR